MKFYPLILCALKNYKQKPQQPPRAKLLNYFVWQMTSIRFLIYCDEIHVKSTLKSGLCGRRSDKVCSLQSFGTIRLLPKLGHLMKCHTEKRSVWRFYLNIRKPQRRRWCREQRSITAIFNPLLVENCKLFSCSSKPTHALLAS